MRAVLHLSAVLLSACALMGQCSSLLNTPPGTDLQLIDESVRTVALPFPFVFAGVSYSTVTVAANGYLWLGSSGTSDWWVAETEALIRGPRIMPLWLDLDPAPTLFPGSGVYWRADASQVSIAWWNVPSFRWRAFFNFECILSASGQITFRYAAGNGALQGPTIVGITAGNHVAPNPRTWASDLPGPTPILNATGYEVFAANQPNVAGRTMTFVPRASPPGNIDFDVSTTTLPTCPPAAYPLLASATSTSIGAGCPAEIRNGAIYEVFTPNSGATPLDLANPGIEFTRNGDFYSWGPGPGFDPSYAQTGTSMSMTDDQVLRGLSFGAMGSFPFGSQVYTSIAICANGYAWLPDGLVGDFTPTSIELVQRVARLAPMWTDHDPSLGGAFYWENGDPLFCRATFVGFRERLQPATNTFQMTLRHDGNIIFSYGAMSGCIANPTVVGISGGDAVDLGSTDLMVGGAPSTGTRRLTGAIAPMTHTIDITPRLGQSFTLSATVPANNLGLGLFALGLTNPSLPLDALFGAGAAPGCSFYTDLQWASVHSFPVGAPTFALSVPVPYALSLAGMTVFSQAAALATQNPAGLLTSNGRRYSTGL